MSSFRIHMAILLLCCSFVARSQCPSDKRQWELAVSQGFLTADQLGDQLTANNNTAAGSGGRMMTSNSGATFLTLRYFAYNRLAIGFAGGISDEVGHYTLAHDPATTVSTYKQRTTTVAMEVYYIYFFRKYLEVYTLFGIGPSFTSVTTNTAATSATATETSDVVRAQYTPIAIRFGGRLGAFAELGVGYKGLFNAGVSFKLGPSCWWRP